jgi:hypothetical protein
MHGFQHRKLDEHDAADHISPEKMKFQSVAESQQSGVALCEGRFLAREAPELLRVLDQTLTPQSIPIYPITNVD